MTNPVPALQNPAFSEIQVRNWSDMIRHELHREKRQFYTLVVRRYLWKDLLAPALFTLAVLLSWVFLLQHRMLQPENAESFYQSVFQGFSAFVALVFAFVTFTYGRGEEQKNVLGRETLADIKELFNERVRVRDEAEVRIWFYLYERYAKTVQDFPDHQRLRFEEAKRTFGRCLVETHLANSLPIRTALILASFVSLILFSAGLLADVGEGPEFTTLLFFGTVFSVVWFISFAWRVLSTITEQTSKKYEQAMEISQHERGVLKSRCNVVLDDISHEEFRQYVIRQRE